MKFLSLIFTLVLLCAASDADAARRLGGGKSVGKQSSNVTQREAAPSAAPGAPTQNAAPATPGTNKAAPGAAGQAAKKPWGAMLGGLAAGLGLAWLASSLGLGGALGQVLLFALVALVVVAAVTWFLRRRAPAGPKLAMQGAAAGNGVERTGGYRPENVGNDASARPWERNSMAFEVPVAPAGATASGSLIGSALRPASATWGIPEGFDSDSFLRAAKNNFVALQAAWDRADIGALRAMMTDEMLAEIKTQLADRQRHASGGPNRTDVVMLEARLLGIDQGGPEYVASVEFSGMIREEESAGPAPFREVWNMTKPTDGSGGWLVAGVQALQ